MSFTDLYLQFPQVDDINDKKYNYAIYTGNQLPDIFTGMTMCFRVTPQTLVNNQQQVFVNYAVASGSTDFDQDDFNKGLNKIRIGANTNALFLTVDNNLSDLSKNPPSERLSLNNGIMVRTTLCEIKL